MQGKAKNKQERCDVREKLRVKTIKNLLFNRPRMLSLQKKCFAFYNSMLDDCFVVKKMFKKKMPEELIVMKINKYT